MARTLYEDAYVTVTVDDGARLVRYVRSSHPYESLDVARDVHDVLTPVVGTLPRGDYTLLIDTRAAPSRNDEAFENAITKAMAGVLGHFSRRAVLVRSAVGKLQIQRLMRGSDGETLICSSEIEALAFLNGKGV